MNLEQFKTHIQTVDDATLDAYFDEISDKAKRARAPAIKAGYALALDAMVIEANCRVYDAKGDDDLPDLLNMTDSELLAELGPI